MPLPDSWVEHLFGRLAVRYGAAFLRQWPDADIAIVKADWADVLDGVRGDSISYALRFLPADKPVNAMQFRDICRRAPEQSAPCIEGPAARPNPERVRAIIARISDAPDDRTPAERVAANLRAIEQKQGGLNPDQRAMLQACELRGEVSGDCNGMFSPIADEHLPPAMRHEASHDLH